LILFVLLYSLVEKTFNENNTLKEDKIILETTAATLIMILAETDKAELVTETLRRGATC
jgi:hypothetical protein